MIHFDLDKLENLPIKQKFHEKWRKRLDRTFGQRNPYFTARKIAKKYIGKPYNDAFSYYCKNVRVEHQNNFIGYFGEYDDYLIDDNGLIQINPKYLPTINERKRTFKSNDVEYITIHKESGIDKKLFKPVEIIVGYKEVVERRWDYGKNWSKVKKLIFVTKPIYKQIGWEYVGKSDYYVLPVHKRIFAKDDDFITVVNKGIEIKFDSPKDPTLIRLKTEKAKKQKLQSKVESKTNVTNWDFILKQGEQRLIKANEDRLLSEKEMQKKLKFENDLVILAHGFDPETSFRTVRKFAR